MAELRRLLIDPCRLEKILNVDDRLVLLDKESHYLKRVLRLKKGDPIAVVDGCGHIWEATFQGDNELFLKTSYSNPLQTIPRAKPLICIAVVIPKRGFDDVLRMSTEIGVDIIQPLISERCFLKKCSAERIQRWKTIICEAVEQSERLWSPQLLDIINIREFIGISSMYPFGIATTRLARLKSCNVWLNKIDLSVNQIWIAIGPEGGWTPEEEELATNSGCESIEMGETILRTSTAAIVASQNMVLQRRAGNISIS